MRKKRENCFEKSENSGSLSQCSAYYFHSTAVPPQTAGACLTSRDLGRVGSSKLIGDAGQGLIERRQRRVRFPVAAAARTTPHTHTADKRDNSPPRRRRSTLAGKHRRTSLQGEETRRNSQGFPLNLIETTITLLSID